MSVTIRLQYLPLSASAADIRAFFHGLRIPDGAVHIVGGADGDAFIGFASDEDGRQAMRRDRGKIHGSEVHLLLSSKQEMNEVISKVREACRLPSPMTSPVVASPANASPAAWGASAASPPSTHPSSRFPPDFTDVAQPAYSRTTPAEGDSFGGRAPPMVGYQANFATRPEQYGGQRGPNVRQMTYPETETRYEASPIYQQREHETDRMGYRASDDRMPQNEYRQEPPRQEMNPAVADAISKLPPHLRPPHGIPPPHLRHLFPGFGPPTDDRQGPPPVRLPPPRDPPVDNRPAFDAREPPRFSDHHERHDMKNESWRDNNGPPRDDRPPWANHGEVDARGQDARPWEFRNSQKENNGYGNQRPPQIPPRNQEPNMRGGAGYPPRGDTRGDNSNNIPLGQRPGFLPRPNDATARASPDTHRFVELSRLPAELLRPSVLEGFIKPSNSLPLSAVKIVYSPQGIHLHTLVRLENDADYNRVLARDGDQGIRVRPATKVIFDKAIDGLPPSIPIQTGQPEKERDDKERRKRSRSRSPRDRTRGAKRSRSRSRDRGGRSRRHRNRSPPRRGRQEPNRWCLQITNVPFRAEQEELLAWMSERVKPNKLSRTFYADGNASDRWVAEFESESLMERARGQRALLNGRTLRMQYIDNDYADEILAIEDKYGDMRKKEYDMKQLAELQLQHLNGTLGPMGVPRFFNNPAATRPAVPQNHFPGGPPRPFPPVGMAPGRPPMEMAGRGGRGGAFGAMRGGRGGFNGGHMMGPPAMFPPGFPRKICNGGPPGGPMEEKLEVKYEAGISAPAPEVKPEVKPDVQMFASLGASGTVLSCEGFPSDVTLQDIKEFFQGYPIDENSVRIRMNANGIGTGEAALCVPDKEKATAAVTAVSGKALRGQIVTVKLAPI